MDPVVFDVGAHIGGYREQVMRFFPQARIHAFEPSKVHYEILMKKISEFNNITANNVGLGSRIEDRILYKDQDVTGLASLTQRDLDHIGKSFEKTESVQIVTLDDYLSDQEIPCTDLLKLDIEGHELDALNGAINTIKHRKITLIQFEFGGTNIDSRITFRDIHSFLRENDYQINL